MAIGIFSTTRVAGEGIALASVTAGLAGLIADQLGHGLARPRLDAVALVTGAIIDAARRLASGDLHGAQAVLPRVDPARLVDG